ncbi:MAG: hypothetical protein R2790_05385 [Flavobacterium haoranii]
MKKVSLIFTGLAIMSLVACNEKKEESSTVVVEKEVPAETQEEPNGTSVSVSSDGVEFSTKDDDTQTEVNIDTDKK